MRSASLYTMSMINLRDPAPTSDLRFPHSALQAAFDAQAAATAIARGYGCA